MFLIVCILLILRCIRWVIQYTSNINGIQKFILVYKIQIQFLVYCIFCAL